MSPHTEKMATRRQQIRADHTRIRLILFLSLVIALLLAAVFAEWICPYDPNGQDLSIALQPPSPAHPFGTDRYGRDMLSRVLMGGQTSIFSALILVGIIAVGGTLLGLLCGYFGGALDAVIMRISDICLTVKNLTYIQAAKLSGTSSLGILFRHILPNIAGPVLVTAMLDIGTMMMEIAALSFLGLGAQPPTAEWGSMMSSGRSMLQTYPWVVLTPGLGIFVSVALFNLLGDTVRDYLDPRNGLRKRRRSK